METIGERIDLLRRKSNLSYSALADVVGGITGDGMRKSITRDSVSLLHINTMCEKLGWDRNYILNGGENNSMVMEPNDSYYKNSLFKAVPYYDINVSAGSVNFLDNGLIEGQKPDDYLFIPSNIDADISLPTFGHSMYPEISNGDKVAYKFIKDWTFFNFGMKYLIVTDEQRMVKYLKKSSIKGNVLLTSRNEDYEDIEMPVDSIRAILQVRYICKIEM
jgi:phage repressor protein C with HTH and peptisase S24 domain